MEAMDRIKSKILVPYQTTTQFFVPRASCLNIKTIFFFDGKQNNILSTKNDIRPKII